MSNLQAVAGKGWKGGDMEKTQTDESGITSSVSLQRVHLQTTGYRLSAHACVFSRALFHDRAAWDAISDHRREQWAIYSQWVFSLRKSGERDVPAFIDRLLCCVCLLLKARSEEFILSLSVTQTACLAQLLISLCLILAVTASRLSAQRVWIIVSCCKSMGFLRSPEKSLFSNTALPFSLLSLGWVSNQCVW